MSQVHYLLIRDEETGDSNITVFISGAEKPYTAHSSHPNYEAIKAGAEANDESIVELFDVAETAAKRFDSLTDRIKVANGRIFLDGDPIDNALTQQVVRFLSEGVEDWKPLVRFFENVLANPNEHSREQLFEWLDRRDFTITDTGYLVGYKGVRPDGNGGYESIHAGPGIVDGEAKNGHLANNPGSTVEIARSAVYHDPSNGCASGLHVGTHDYANSWGPVCLKVLVNPRDVVSVPTDCDAAKVRTCRYQVVEVVSERLTSAIDTGYADDEDDYGEEYCDYCDGPHRDDDSDY